MCLRWESQFKVPCVPYNPDFYLPGVPGSLISTSEGYLGTCARVAGVEDDSRGPLMNQRIVFAGTPGSRIIRILWFVAARIVGYEVDRVIGGGRCTQADERRRRR